MKFQKSSTTLNEILNCQRSPFDKTGLGYSEKKVDVEEEASTSSKQSSEEKTKSYVDILKKYIKVEDNEKQEQNVPQETNLSRKDKTMNILPLRGNHTIR
jgi:hypothetical protein